MSEGCGSCFFGRTLVFSLPASGLRGGAREDVDMLVCAHHSPNLTSGLTDAHIIEARWAQVRPDYWCGDWSGDGAVVVRPTGTPT